MKLLAAMIVLFVICIVGVIGTKIMYNKKKNRPYWVRTTNKPYNKNLRL